MAQKTAVSIMGILGIMILGIGLLLYFTDIYPLELLFIEIIVLIGFILILAVIAAIIPDLKKSEEDIAAIIRTIGWGLILFSLIFLILLAGFGFLLTYIEVIKLYPTPEEAYNAFTAIAAFGGLLLILGAVLLWYSGHWLSGIYKRRSKRLSDESEDLETKSDKTGISIDGVNTDVLKGDKSISDKLKYKERIDRKLK